MGGLIHFAVYIGMPDCRFIELLGLKLAGEAIPEELEELQRLISKNEEWRLIAEEITHNIVSEITEDEKNDAETLFFAHSVSMQLSGRFEEHKTKVKPWQSWKKTVLSFAAVLMIIAGGFYTFQKWQSFQDNFSANEIVTKKGNKSNIKLQDGTQVSMNSDTRLSYGSDFGTKIREVKLEGEAFFDVAHDAAKPFIIHAGNINIKVLGTAFNVKNYIQDGTIETSLIRGKIEVTFNDRPNEKIILHPGEKLVIKNLLANTEKQSDRISESKIELNSVNHLQDSVVAETAWLKNRIVFNNESFENIAHQLERKFDVDFIFKNANLKGDAYTGDYEKESLEKILEQMSLSKHFNYIIEDKKIIIE